MEQKYIYKAMNICVKQLLSLDPCNFLFFATRGLKCISSDFIHISVTVGFLVHNSQLYCVNIFLLYILNA